MVDSTTNLARNIKDEEKPHIIRGCTLNYGKCAERNKIKRGSQMDVNIQLVLSSMKLSQILRVKEIKYPIVNTQGVIYTFE